MKSLPAIYFAVRSNVINPQSNQFLTTNKRSNARSKFTKFLLGFFVFFALGQNSYGQITAWDFAGKTGDEISVPATTLNGNLSSSSIVRGTGIVPNAPFDGGVYASSDYAVGGTLANAITTNEYLEFTIKPNLGYQASLTTLNANFKRNTSGPNMFQWQYSLDGFATAGTNIGGPISYTLSTLNGDVQDPIDLSSIVALQNNSYATTVTIRLYAWGATAPSGYFAFGRPGAPANDLAVDGSVSLMKVHNISISKDYVTIQDAINDPLTLNTHIITADAGSYNEQVTVNKSVIIRGANTGIAGNGVRVPESILTGNNAAHSGFVITANNVTIDGFTVRECNGMYESGIYTGTGVSGTQIINNILTDNKIGVYALGSNNTVFHNLFDANNRPGPAGGTGLYSYSSSGIVADANEFKNHSLNAAILFDGPAAAHSNVTITHNYIHSNTNVGGSAVYCAGINGLLIKENEITHVAGARAVKIAGGNNNVVVSYNNLNNNTRGIQITTDFGSNTNVQAHYNHLAANSTAGIQNDDASLSANVTCNWYGNISGPAIGTNIGGIGSAVAGSGGKIYANWLNYSTDASANIGVQLPTAISAVPGLNTNAGINHYRVLSNAVGCLVNNQTLTLSGTFNLGLSPAQAEWAKGNNQIAGDGQGAINGYGDDYSIAAPDSVTGVTITASSLGSVIIQGPGDLAAVALESVLYFNNNDATSNFQNWTISNIVFRDFDVSILQDLNGGNTTAFSNFKIQNNQFDIPEDLNATFGGETPNLQNIGIHYSFGANQEISGNIFNVDGTGVSDGSSYSSTVVMQSSTSGGTVYNGLKIKNNAINVTGNPNPSPAVIRGIWENGHNSNAAIEISGNTFTNVSGANTADKNRQTAFWVTSRSGSTNKVEYKNNEVSNFKEGLAWLGGLYTSNTAPDYEMGAYPVEVKNNKFNATLNAVIVRKSGASTNLGSPGYMQNNSFTNFVSGGKAISNEGTGDAQAVCNWYGTTSLPAITALHSGPVYLNSYLDNGGDGAGTGFQPTGSCVFPPVHNVTKDIYYTTIQLGVNGASDGDELTVVSGTYSEQVLVNKRVSITGIGATKPVIDFTGTATGKPTLFDVSVNGVTIDNFNFNVDLSKLSSAIIASGTTIDTITVKNNLIGAYGTHAGAYGERNAVSVNYGSYRVASSGVNSITFKDNTVTGSGPASYFRAGISADEAGGTFTGNTLQTINHDIQVRFGSNGAITISGNNFNGGGVELAEQNATAGPVTLANNTFTPVGNDVKVAVLRLRNNQSNVAHVISGNTFNYNTWAVSLENMRNIILDDNTFSSSTPGAHAVVVNTKSLSSNSSTIVQTTIDGTFTNNDFNGTGTGLTFLNHDSDADAYGTFTVGTVGNENNFASSLSSFITFDGQTGSTNGSTFPIYPVSDSWPTTMACWDQDINIQNNKLDVGAGLQLPVTMNFAQRTALEAKLTHDPDNACLGQLIYFLPVHNLISGNYYLTIQAAINAATSGDVIECAEWTFNERVVIDKSLTLQGIDSSSTIITGTGLAGTGNGITINNGVTNVTIQKLTVKNFAGLDGNTHAGIKAVGGNNNLKIDLVGILDNVGGSGFFANGPINVVDITHVTSKGHTVGARGIVIWNGLKQSINISNNHVYGNNCCGIELQDGSATGVTMNNNNVHDNGDNGMSAVGLEGPGANVMSGNTVTNNGRFGIEIKNPNGSGAASGAGSIVISNNTVSRTVAIVDARDIAGIAVQRRGLTGSNVDVPYGVQVNNNNVSGYVQTSASDGFGIVMEGINHTVSNNTVSGNDVGIQRQAGHLPYPGDGDQSNLADTYFGRGNSPISCSINISGSIFSGNTVNTRDVGNSGGAGFVVNTNTGKSYCSIQTAINDPATLSGHTITATAGTYNESLNISKSIILKGAKADVCAATRSGAEAIINCVNGIGVNASNVTINGFTIQGQTTASAPGFGFAVYMVPTNTGTQLLNNIIKNNVVGSTISNTGGAPSQVLVSCNWFDANNNPGPSSGAGIYTDEYVSGGIISNVKIDNNKFTNHINDGGIDFSVSQAAQAATGVTITRNSFDANRRAAFLYNTKNSSFSENEISNSTGAGSGEVRIYGGVHNLDVKNNKFSAIAGSPRGVRINIDGGGTNSNIAINQNSFTGYSASIPAIEIPAAPDYTGTLDATCNWFGSTVPATVDAQIIGSVNYVPWLISGTDAAMGTMGFQPSVPCTACALVLTPDSTYASCPALNAGTVSVAVSGGTGTYSYLWNTVPPQTTATATGLTIGVYKVVVTDISGCKDSVNVSVTAAPGVPLAHNINTNKYYCTIQAGIDDASTLSGHVIETTSGTFNEQVTVNKRITLKGANADVACGARVPETIINSSAGSGSITVTIAADDVTINGFTIKNPLGSYGISGDGTNNTTIKYNIVTDIGNATTGSGPTHGIAIQPSVAAVNNLVISNNCVNNIRGGQVGTPAGANGSAGAITLGFSASNFNVNNALIEKNIIENITANNFNGSGGKGAYGILSNVGSGAGTGETVGLIIRANEISNLNGRWSHAIGLEGETPGALVENNKVSGLSSAAGDAAGVSLEANATGAATVQIHNNSFTGSNLAIFNQTATNVDATCNWFGSTVAATIASKMSGPVTYLPWLTNGTDASSATGFQPSVPCVSCPAGGIVYNVTQSKFYCTIQGAISDGTTIDGDVIQVYAGTYKEQINVTKRLDIRGANYGIAGTGARGAASIIVPPSELNLAATPREWSDNPLITLAVNGIKMDGFDISGDNTTISGHSYAGMNVEAGRGIKSTGNNVVFQNNIVEKFTYIGFHSEGGLASPHYKDIVITNNKFDNIQDLNQLGYGMAMYIQGSAAAITNNTVTNSRSAIQVQPYQVVQGAAASVCSNNNFSIWRQGIYYNYAEVGASAWTIDANTITACQPPAAPTGRVLWEGMRAETMRASGNGGTLSNNIIDGTGAATDLTKWWGVWGMNYRGEASTSNQVFFTGNTVSNVELGMVHSAAADIVFTGNSLSASNKAISVQREYSSAGVMQAVGGIYNINALGGNTINGVATAGASLAQLFTIEDAINHKIDNSTFGFVSVKANNDYVTVNSFTAPNTKASIQRGVDAASSGWTVNVAAGTYEDNVAVNKSLSILGPNATIDPLCAGAGRVPEAIILPAAMVIEPATTGAIFRLGNGAGHTDVTIKGFTLDGSNPTLGAGRTLNGVAVHTGAGIVNSVGSFDANPGGYDVTMIVQNNIIKNFERYGVLADGVPARTPMAGTIVSNNKIDNLPSGNAPYGGGRGRGIAFEENHYGTASNNCISRVNVGWQDDNYNLPSPGAGTVVSNNTISSYHRGIFHNLQYQNATDATITGNNISAEASNNSGTDFGLELASIQTAVGATVTGNNVSGKKYGILLWNNPTSNTITVTGGTLTGNDVGIYATNDDPQFGASTGNSMYTVSGVSVTGSTSKGVLAKNAGSPGGTVSLMLNNTTVNATGSTTGVAVEASSASPSNTATVSLSSGSIVNGGSTTPVLITGNQAQLYVGTSNITAPASGANNAIQFSGITSGNIRENLVLAGGTVIGMNANTSARAFASPQYSIVAVDGAWAVPSKITGGLQTVLVDGKINFNSGILSTTATADTIEFGNNAADIMTGANTEKASSYILGRAKMLSRAVGNNAVDMLGVNLAAEIGIPAANVGNLVITRTTTDMGSIDPVFPGNNSIRTVWNINPSITTASRTDVRYRYLNIGTNTNLQTPSSIYAYRHSGGVWNKISASLSSALVGDVYTTSSFNAPGFSPWTLSSVAVDLPDLSPLAFVNGASFNTPNVNRDFIVSLENSSAAPTGSTVTFRIIKPSVFNISYDLSSGTSVVLGGIANSNSDFSFADMGSYIEVSTNVSIAGNSNKIVGFHISRKPGFPANTSENISISIVAGSGGDVTNGNNNTTLKVIAN